VYERRFIAVAPRAPHFATFDTPIAQDRKKKSLAFNYLAQVHEKALEIHSQLLLSP
jgi:hypothetical protein